MQIVWKYLGAEKMIAHHLLLIAGVISILLVSTITIGAFFICVVIWRVPGVGALVRFSVALAAISLLGAAIIVINGVASSL